MPWTKNSSRVALLNCRSLDGVTRRGFNDRIRAKLKLALLTACSTCGR